MSHRRAAELFRHPASQAVWRRGIILKWIVDHTGRPRSKAQCGSPGGSGDEVHLLEISEQSAYGSRASKCRFERVMWLTLFDVRN